MEIKESDLRIGSETNEPTEQMQQNFNMVTSESIQRLDVEAGVITPFESMFKEAAYGNRKKDNL